MAGEPGNVTPYRRTAPTRPASQFQPRMSAIEIVGTAEHGWSFRLNDRGTHLELALLRLAFGVDLIGEDERGMILRPRKGTPLPRRDDLAAILAAIHERRCRTMARDNAQESAGSSGSALPA